MELKARIFKARNDAKMTQDALAAAVGVTRGAVAQWESGDVRPRHTTMLKIAAATGKSIAWLETGGDKDGSAIGMPVVGEVAAGMWREGTVYFPTYIQPVAPSPEYPAHAQRLYRVSGTSIDRVAANGEYLHAVDVQLGGIHPENGDLVIVRRMQHGLAEYTAKQFVVERGRQFLRPESNDPDWQSDIAVDDDGGAEIEITDIVIGKWAPVARRRPITRT
jgi:DNA-binding XRE family transcriptional regulator